MLLVKGPAQSNGLPGFRMQADFILRGVDVKLHCLLSQDYEHRELCWKLVQRTEVLQRVPCF